MAAGGEDIEDGDEREDLGDDDLPPELLEAERKLKEDRERKKREKLAAGGQMGQFANGLGYEVVS